MSCNTNCQMPKDTKGCNSLFESTREQRLEAIARAKREEELRRAQIARLNEIRQSIAVRDAKEIARYEALKDTEAAFKIRERDILEKHLDETLAAMKRMQDQYQEFVATTEAISRKLKNPAELFAVSSIIAVDEFKDYFKLTYKDGRVLNLPFAAIDFMLKTKLDAIQCEFDEHSKSIIQLQTDMGNSNEQISKMADLFKTLVANVATHETDQEVKFQAFKCEVEKEIAQIKSDVSVIAESFKSLTSLVESLNAAVNQIIKG